MTLIHQNNIPFTIKYKGIKPITRRYQALPNSEIIELKFVSFYVGVLFLPKITVKIYDLLPLKRRLSTRKSDLWAILMFMSSDL